MVFDILASTKPNNWQGLARFVINILFLTWPEKWSFCAFFVVQSFLKMNSDLLPDNYGKIHL
jgi:hypothetical protein